MSVHPLPDRDPGVQFAVDFERAVAVLSNARRERRYSRADLAQLWQTAVDTTRERMRDAEIGAFLEEAGEAAARVVGDDAPLIDRLDAAIHYLYGWRDLVGGRLAAALAALGFKSSTQIIRGRTVSIEPREVILTKCCGRPLGDCEHVEVQRIRTGSYVSLSSS